MKDVEIFPAVYHDTGVSRFAGNPFIGFLVVSCGTCQRESIVVESGGALC